MFLHSYWYFLLKLVFVHLEPHRSFYCGRSSKISRLRLVEEFVIIIILIQPFWLYFIIFSKLDCILLLINHLMLFVIF